MAKGKASTPDQEPPERAAEGAGAGGDAAPTEQPPAEQAGAAAAATSTAKPDLYDVTGASLGGSDAVAAPPAGEGAAGDGIATWLGDKRVSSLWSINQVRNSWVGISGVGWVKLSNASDSAIVAMTMLASHAKEKQSRFDYRQEADGMIHEIYAW